MTPAVVPSRGGAVAARALLLALLAGCSKPAATEPSQPRPLAAQSSITTPWVKVRSPEHLALLELPARVLAAPQSVGVISPSFPARVTSVLVRTGQKIDRGAPAVSVIMPSVITAAGALAGARTRLDAYTKRKAQLNALRADGLIRISEISEVETHLAEAKADEQTALATLRSAGLGPGDGTRLLEDGGAIVLRSPVAGVVTEVNATVGEIRDGSGEPLVRVAGEGPARIEARLSHALPPGARFEFIMPLGTAVELRAVGQSPVVDSRDGTRVAWFEPATAETRLAQGLTGKLRVAPAAGAKVSAVPASALQMSDGKARIMVRRPSGSEMVEVKVLAISGADAMVEGALSTSDEVAAEAPAAVWGGEADAGTPAGKSAP